MARGRRLASGSWAAKGVMTVGGGVSVTKQPPEPEPGTTVGTFSRQTQEQFMKEYRKKYPPRQATAASMEPTAEQRFQARARLQRSPRPLRELLQCVRTPQTGGGGCDVRITGGGAGAAVQRKLLFSGKILEWDPVKMQVKG
jgi:hypothetical protein